MVEGKILWTPEKQTIGIPCLYDFFSVCYYPQSIDKAENHKNSIN